MENNKAPLMPMEESEYTKRLAKIESDYEQEKKKLYLAYGLSQAKYKVGDIIKDHRGVILVDRVTVSKTLGLPETVYSGAELKKDFKPKANGSRLSIYGNHRAELLKSA